MFNRAQIMKNAWVIVRRFKGNGEAVEVVLARALKSAWWDAKTEMRVKKAVAADNAAFAAEIAGLTKDQIMGKIVALENCDHLSFADRQKLADYTSAYYA